MSLSIVFQENCTVMDTVNEMYLTTDFQTSNTSNVSDPDELLRKLNDELALRYLPVIIYMLLLIFTGFFGNILVIIVYSRKKPKASTHYFIINLAILDMLTVLIGMPTEIADLRFPYMFYATAACKTLRTVESLSTMGSIITLMAIAIDRYNRICKYGKQMTTKRARRICYIAVLIGVITCWPAAIVFGKKTVHVDIPGANAVDCSTDDSMKGTKYPLLYYASLFLYFVICVVFFTVVYARLIFYIRNKKKKGNLSKRGMSYSDRKFASTSVTDTDESSLSIIGKDQAKETTNVPPERKQPGITPQNSRVNSTIKYQIRTSKTTVMLGIVTVVFVLSFLPFLAVMVVRNIVKNFEQLLSPTAEIFYKFCLKSYFINNAVNPVIYSFLNIQFRQDVKKLLFFKRGKDCCSCAQK